MSCGPGASVRSRVCPGIICDSDPKEEEVKGCEISDCSDAGFDMKFGFLNMYFTCRLYLSKIYLYF